MRRTVAAGRAAANGHAASLLPRDVVYSSVSTSRPQEEGQAEHAIIRSSGSRPRWGEKDELPHMVSFPVFEGCEEIALFKCSLPLV